MPCSWCILSHRTRAASLGLVHSTFVISPTPLGQLDIPAGNGAAVLTNYVKQDEEILRAPVQDAVKVPAAVTAQLAERLRDLRGAREWERRQVVRQVVHLFDLVFN